MRDDNAMAGENAAAPGSDPVDERLFDVRLRPHRSLTPRNAQFLILVFALMAFMSSVPFIVMGAWPVGGFMGLDVILLYVAFRANFHAARAYEDVIVTPLELLLAKVSARGFRREWRFNPVWVRLDREEHAEFGLQRLSLNSRGSHVEIASFLGPDAKADFASGLSRALGEARRGARYD